jgi:hypothetical protein
LPPRLCRVIGFIPRFGVAAARLLWHSSLYRLRIDSRFPTGNALPDAPRNCHAALERAFRGDDLVERAIFGGAVVPRNRNEGAPAM